MSKYQELAARTVSPNFYPASVPGVQLLGLLELATIAGEYADRQKRAFFYGTPFDPDPKVQEIGEDVIRRMPAGSSPGYTPELLHGLLGVISEAAEISEALLESMASGKELDLVNIAEEVGDLRWYLALMATSLDKDEAEIEEKNIAKLRARFPDRFTEDDAVNRDLEREREVLHAKTTAEGLKQFLSLGDYLTSQVGDTQRSYAEPETETEMAPECCGHSWSVEVLLTSGARETWDIDCAGWARLNECVGNGVLVIRDVDVSTEICYPLVNVSRYEIVEND